MADSDKAKSEKIAAAKKRVAEMKKKQKAKAGSASTEKKEEKKEEKPAAAAPPAEQTPEPEASASTPPPPAAEDKPAPADDESSDDVPPLSPSKTAPPSLAQQSRARSASFRAPSISGTPGMFSPEGETAPDIYRKHVARIEELEKENKRLAKEASDAESRWQKAETELEELRDGDEASDKKDAGEVEKLRNDLAALQRQNDQLQSQLTVKAGAGGRHGSSPSISVHSPPAMSELEAQLTSKSATIETMELEMSRLRAQVERLSLSSSSPSEQISALEEKLARAEKAAALAQRELGDLKRNLERTAEKAVKAGSGLASAETKIRTLEKEVGDVKAERDELAKKVEGLEKKVATLTTLHKEQDGRMQSIRKEKDARDKEVLELKNKLETAEAENTRLRKKDAAEGGGDDDGLDELEDEGRLKLQKRINDLEAENTDLRRGIWHEKRKEMQLGPDDAATGGKFTDVDLGGTTPNRRKSVAGGGGIGDFFSQGLNALTGQGHGEDEGFLEDDEDLEFDEEAFRKAQEEEAKNRLERIREIKRGLKNWEGWRLDLVENRRGGGEGIGEIFEI